MGVSAVIPREKPKVFARVVVGYRDAMGRRRCYTRAVTAQFKPNAATILAVRRAVERIGG